MIIEGDCRVVMPSRAPFDLVIADPPYAVTAIGWDKIVAGWLSVARDTLRPSGSLWVFGSMRPWRRRRARGSGFSSRYSAARRPQRRPAGPVGIGAAGASSRARSRRI